MKNITSGRTSAKRSQLIETAKCLFFKHGVRRVTVEEICEKAKVSKVTFYKYFTDKIELAEFIRDQLVEEGFSKFDEINNLAVSYPKKIDLMTQWRVGFLSAMSSDFIEDIMNVQDIQQEVKKRYLRNIRKAQENGEIKPDISPELIWLVTEKLNELTEDGSWRNVSTDYIEFQRQLRKMYFGGLLVNEKTIQDDTP